jgi:hypothetical protein
MKRFPLFLCVFILAVAGSVYAGKPTPGCSDVPITVTFLATVPQAAISNDINEVYQGGVDGVDNTQIHFGNDCNGSRDATLLPSNAGRKKPRIRQFQLQVPNAIAGSILSGQAGQPTFAGGPSFLSPGFLNIRNILGYTLVVPPVYPSVATYYTRMTVQFIGPTDGNSYRLLFYPDDMGTCPVPGSCVPDRTGTFDPPSLRNNPQTAAWVKVTWTPRNPADSNSRDQWDVEGISNINNDVVGTLLDSNGVHYGQYSMPFSIRIRALTVLPQ